MDKPLTYIAFAFPGLPNVRCAFVSGLGGFNISFSVDQNPRAVLANRLALRRELGFEAWYSLHQVHGTQMVFEPEGDTLQVPSSLAGDALATTRPGLALAIKTADCQPILLAHAGGRHVAALHVGWRGNAAGFPQSGVRDFCARYGLSPGDVMAVRGPSLSPAASLFTDFESAFSPQFREFYDASTQRMDLWSLTRAQLAAAGLKPGNIFGLDLCTYSLPQFFSYRREKNTGRQASLIWLEKP